MFVINLAPDEGGWAIGLAIEGGVAVGGGLIAGGSLAVRVVKGGRDIGLFTCWLATRMLGEAWLWEGAGLVIRTLSTSCSLGDLSKASKPCKEATCWRRPESLLPSWARAYILSRSKDPSLLIFFLFSCISVAFIVIADMTLRTADETQICCCKDFSWDVMRRIELTDAARVGAGLRRERDGLGSFSLSFSADEMLGCPSTIRETAGLLPSWSSRSRSGPSVEGCLTGCVKEGMLLRFLKLSSWLDWPGDAVVPIPPRAIAWRDNPTWPQSSWRSEMLRFRSLSWTWSARWT